ncbi:pentapeptide repeat-containing protein [Streptomyces regalis]|uniref:pentapeptide repeat-containing protein n=1 Tax=Streptomyces regalis TaxID=68262 RepID=UPI0007C63F30|nr:pentapeptide repeat-containing protein [Streptomyces regalis]
MKPKTKRIVVAVVLAAVVIGYALLLWKGPWWVDGAHLRTKNLQPADGVVITGFRTMLVALGAGAVAALGLYYTHKSHQHTEKLFEHTREKDREQAELTREAQVTERYVEAIKLLSSDNLPQRLGGIYSLERIMRDSEKDHATVVAVLAAFVREKAPAQEQDSEDAERSVEFSPPQEIQAALTVLGRRPVREERFRIDLARTDLCGTDLSGARLANADLRRANLELANLADANLAEASLYEARLQRADLRAANLEGANLHEAHLERAILVGAHLRRAILMGAHLERARLPEAHLEGASLRGAHLERAELSGAHLEGADLMGAHLEGADMSEAHLQGARLFGAHLDEASLGGTDLALAEGCKVDMLVTAQLWSSTRLPSDIAGHEEIQARIKEFESLPEA